MDLSVEAEAFGSQVNFSENEVPTISSALIEDMEGAEALEIPQVGAGRTGIYVEAIKKAKGLIHDRPVLAGCIGPYSLAGRLMDVTQIMYLCFDEPDMVKMVLEKATEFLLAYGRAFKEAGADGVIMAEPLAGLLSPEMNREFSAPYVKRIIDALQDDEFAVIYHNCGNTVLSLLPELFAMDAAGYHFGNAVEMEKVLAQAPKDVLCMGNVDPVRCFTNGTPDEMTAAVQSLLKACGDSPNFLLSSGCDIPPHAKWENIRAFYAAAAACK